MANKIKLLSEQVANQIAAGEVVERPASIVKELMENSLDAGAIRVVVEVEQGGRRLIRVVDDGFGMSRDDVLLSLERHATSKIRASSDLFSIQTLGFRGEALPSIASVSEMTLVTREEDSESGVRVRLEAGVIKSVSEAGVPPGTEIVIRKLFSNVPARRKFLKSIETELGHITTLVSNMALARPDVHVTLIHNGRVIYDLPSSSDLSGRLRHALGADALRQLMPVDRTFSEVLHQGELRIHGFVSGPSYTRSSTRSLHVFVNRRFVRDRLINHAVFESYRTLVPKGRYPLVVLFIDLPPDAVDVNVHPAKHEIRFRDQAAVHQAVMDAIMDALKLADRSAASGADHDLHLPFRGRLEPAKGEGISRRDTMPPGDAGNNSGDPELLHGVENAMRRYHEKLDRDGARDFTVVDINRRGWRKRDDGNEGASVLPAPAPGPEPGFRFSDLHVIGQAAGTYILAQGPESLLIIDQHAAHERIMFETLWSQFKSEAVARQPLLFPATVDLTFQEARRVEAHQETLLRLGLEVEPFGGNTMAVKALPALLAGADPARLLLEVVDQLGEAGGGAGISERLDEVFAVMACHSVVRAHEKLERKEIEALFQSMDELEFPGHCPHGRDVVVRIKFREMEKWFGR